MKTWHAKFEVVTPMFLAGADQTKAELRPASFKGLMRWWFRAAKGKMTPEEEGRLFGSTDQTSLYRMRLKPQGALKIATFHKGDFQNKFNGLLYCAFSMDTKVAGELRQRAFIEPSSQFDLMLSWGASLSEADQKALFSTLWLLTWLGGIGSRSRRGFGSICLKTVEGDLPLGLNFQFQGQTISDLKDFLQKNLSTVRSWIGAHDPGTDLSQYTVLHPQNSKILLWNQPFSDWKKAIDTVGNMMKEFRLRKQPDYTEVKRFITDGAPPKAVERAAFGLPIEFYFSSLDKQKATVSGQGSDQKGHERRASPLLIKVIKTLDQKYALLFILMKAQILPSEESITVSYKNYPKSVKQPSFRIIEDFLTTKVAPFALEVKL